MDAPLATTLNLDKAVAACEKKLKEEKDEGKPEFKKEMVAGVSAYSINSKEFKVGEKAVVPFVASLDGQLILAASSKAVLEKQIALYRDGKGASADFGSFALGANDMLRIKLAKVGENVKKSIPDPAMLQELNGFVPDADKLVLGLGAVELALSASADGKDAKLDLAVETASDADADKLRTLAKSGLMPLTAMVKGSKDDGMKLAAGVLQAAKIAGEGKVANLSVAYAADDLIKYITVYRRMHELIYFLKQKRIREDPPGHLLLVKLPVFLKQRSLPFLLREQFFQRLVKSAPRKFKFLGGII